MKRRAVVLVVLAIVLVLDREARAAESSLGVGIGSVKAESINATLWFTGDFRFHLSEHVALAPEVSYWKRSDNAALGLISASASDLEFGANVLGVFRPGRHIDVFGGGGGGLHNLTSTLGITGVTSASKSLTKAGLDLLLGIDLRFSETASFFVGARHDWVLGLGGSDPGQLDQNKLYGGFRFRF